MGQLINRCFDEKSTINIYCNSRKCLIAYERDNMNFKSINFKLKNNVS